MDEHYLSELMRVPEFVEAYEEDGLAIDDFQDYGLTRKTLRQFLQADADLDQLVRDIILPTP